MKYVNTILISLFLIFSCCNIFANEHTVEDQTMVISGHPDYPPYLWREGDLLKGAGTELIKSICREIKIKCVVKYVGPWKRVLDLASRGKISLILGLHNSKERISYLNYTESFMEHEMSVITRQDSNFKYKAIHDLVGLRGITMFGYQFGEKTNTFIDTRLNVTTAMDSSTMFTNLIKDRVDYVIWDKNSALIKKRSATKYKGLKLLSPPIAKIKTFMAFSKKSKFSRYLEKFNKILKRMEKNKTPQKYINEALSTYKSDDKVLNN